MLNSVVDTQFFYSIKIHNQLDDLYDSPNSPIETLRTLVTFHNSSN